MMKFPRIFNPVDFFFISTMLERFRNFNAQKIPMFVANSLFDEVEDMSDFLNQINEGSAEDSEEDSDDD